MKRFSSLIDGIYYMVSCPLCHESLRFDCKGYDVHTSYSSVHYIERPLIELVFDLNGKDTMTIDADLGVTKIEVSLNHETYSHGVFAQRFIGNYNANYYPSYNGILFLGMGMMCVACQQYKYSIGIEVNQSTNKIWAVFLNSETLTIEDGDVRHQIRNVYGSAQTEYLRITNMKEYSKDNKAICLPLIPLDLQDPRATLDRVKTLVIFS